MFKTEIVFQWNIGHMKKKDAMIQKKKKDENDQDCQENYPEITDTFVTDL